MDVARFTPALGYAALTPFYDVAVRLLTRERHWRDKLLEQVSPHDGEAILDVGCGTGTFARQLKLSAPGARVIGIDPDVEVLARAAARSEAASLDIEWRRGFARDVGAFDGEFDKAVSSLVFHQVPLVEKRAGIDAMVRAVRRGGEVHIADYGRQESRLMRELFRVVQLLDGKQNTQANADGVMEQILTELERSPCSPEVVVRTPTGAISLFRLYKGSNHAA